MFWVLKRYLEETNLLETLLPQVPSLLFLLVLFMGLRSMASGMGGGGMPGGGRNIFSIGKAFPQGSKDVKSKARP